MRFDLTETATRFTPQSIYRRAIPRGGTLLDIGCGDFSRVNRYVGAARPDLAVVGIEKFEGATIYGQVADSETLVKPERYSRVQCDIDNDAFPFGQIFDAVYFSHVIEHLDHPRHVLREARRVLKQNGTIYVETPGPRSLAFRRPAWMAPEFGGTLNFYDDPTHLGSPYTNARLETTLKETGFSVVRQGAFRELGLMGTPVYAAMMAAGLPPLLPNSVRSGMFGAGCRNLLGFAIYAIGRRSEATPDHLLQAG